MVVEELLIIVHYCFIVSINKFSQVSILVIWIIINAFMISLFVDFVDLIINYWKKTYGNKNKENNKFVKFIRTVWDHDLSTKSLQ